MKMSFSRIALALFSVSLALVPETSRACGCCDWLFGCCKPKPAPVTYCPPPAAPCAVAPQQVNYVPQTCYRTEYTCVPVTTCKPVTTCDPCGNAQTVMQPMTTYVRKPVMVPYTTYRPVVTAAPVAPCATCGAAPYYNAPAVTTATYAAPAAMPSTGCATCGGGAAAATYTAPAMSAPAMSAPMMSAPAMGSPAPMSAPSLSPTPATQPAPTFQPGAAQYQPGAAQYSPIPNPPADNSSLRPIQPAAPNSDAPSSDSKTNSSNAPLLQDPLNRTTSLIGPAYVTTAIFHTAERTNVFKPAVIEKESWSAAPADDTWQSSGK